MLIELNRLAVFLLGVGEEIAGDVLPGRDLQDGLGADALMDMKGDRIDIDGFGLALAGPFEPRLMGTKCFGERAGLVVGQRALPRGRQKFGQSVGTARPVEAQGRIKPGL